jgi:transcription-repair coupling factor (superfamily II helicase)
MALPFGKGKYLVVTPTPVEAEDLVGDLKFFSPDAQIYLFPGLDRNPFMGKYQGIISVGERLHTAVKMMEASPLVVVTHMAAILRKLPKPQGIKIRTLTIAKGEELDFQLFKEFLAESGYQATTQVENHGEYAVRGGLVDLYPMGRTLPVRVEFFGDQVDSIRSFLPEDQKSMASLSEVTITPVSQVPMTKETSLRAYGKLQELAKEKGWMDLLWEPIAQGFLEGSFFSDFENWSPLFEDNLTGFNDFLKGLDFIPILYEPGRLMESGANSYLGFYNHFNRLEGDGRPHLPLESLFVSPEPLLAGLKGGGQGLIIAREAQIQGALTDEGIEIIFPTETTGDLKALNLPHSTSGFLTPLVGKVKSLLGRGFTVSLVLRTREQVRRLTELLYEHDLTPILPLRLKGVSPLPRVKGTGELLFKVGQLSGGFVAPYDAEAFIAEEEIFLTRRVRRITASEEGRGALSFASLSDIAPGDYIVHSKHGIGQYQGLSNMTVSTGYRGDFLSIEYWGGDMLYVPVESFGVVSKYVGPTDKPPSLDKLGAGSWEKVKAKVKEEIRLVAEELIKLYARRKVAKGFAFDPSDGDFLNFEAAFPYEETADQAQAIKEVIEDLENPNPMDRLVCGDVGFGKTEVAIRAAYKVVSNNKQVAVLVPTTILAKQHERSFKERFADWPVIIDSVSRLKKSTTVKEILNDVKLGKIDIIIGTHRLLQKDVSFKDLGLLVVDEEHRFGVTHKEKLKQFRVSVDVLSMSATPIPRSLSMSMSGLRDFSIIQTPPVDRLAVKTSIVRADDTIICEAIDRELARGGQVYFIHNRVRDIHAWVRRLKELLPLVRFGVGHGQLNARELEDVVMKFWKKDIDVWVSTTIVESGLDFPDANTIIIDKADLFGLAQLYQLRGRVGRSRVQAHCYLMVDDPDTLTLNARKRLQALMENAELGSGYQVALHDLQIRGSGNVLGVAQHGQASLVGYEMYTHLIEEAISELRNEPILEDYEPEIHIGKPAFLPESYASDTTARIVLYRRLSKANSVSEIELLGQEIKDRFGPLPPEAKNLIKLSKLKILVKAARAKKLTLSAEGLTMEFFTDSVNSVLSVSQKLLELASDSRRKITISPKGELFVPTFNLKLESLDVEDALRQFLEYLLDS